MRESVRSIAHSDFMLRSDNGLPSSPHARATARETTEDRRIRGRPRGVQKRRLHRQFFGCGDGTILNRSGPAEEDRRDERRAVEPRPELALEPPVASCQTANTGVGRHRPGGRLCGGCAPGGCRWSRRAPRFSRLPGSEVPANGSSCTIPVSAVACVWSERGKGSPRAGVLGGESPGAVRPAALHVDGRRFGCTYRSGQPWRCLQQLPL